MGKMKENPRYNIISCRVSDEELAQFEAVVGRGNRTAFVLQAIQEKLQREQSRRPGDAMPQRV